MNQNPKHKKELALVFRHTIAIGSNYNSIVDIYQIEGLLLARKESKEMKRKHLTCIACKEWLAVACGCISKKKKLKPKTIS